MAKEEMSNVKCLVAFMLNGEKIAVGQVVSKEKFTNKGDWLNLCHMRPARAEETNEKVGKPASKGKKGNNGMPGTNE